ncbi:MAG: DEAD/DEAH box helicase [Synergistaceae bacterium]|nr:DEAD/DEAH box helicase [Synergistaceae bacterium]
MLILHTAFEQDLIYLWGECSFENRRLRSREKEGCRMLPWGAKPPQLRAALRAFGLRGGRKAPAEEAPTVSLLLPARGKFPLPSSPILGEIHDSGEHPALVTYYVEALVLSFTEFTQLLRIIRESGERLSFPGLLFADDLKFMCRALEYAAVLVQRGTYIPDMEPRGDSFVSQWRPIILAKYQDEFSSFAAAMPPVLCAFSAGEPLEAPRSKHAGAMLLLESMTDMLIRSSQQGAADRGRRVNAGNPHEIWLRSLIWQKAPLIKWNEEMASLYPQIRAWADSLKAVTAQPWRLFMRLDEPIGEGERIWTLSWHLQSTQDPSLVIPAERVWSPADAERGWFEHTQTNPRRYMLQILGHLATRVPYIAESLEVPYPCECHLTIDNLFDFLQNHLPSIMDQGIQVQFPSTWGQISDRPRLSVRANLHDEDSFAPGGRMQLSDMLDVDWSVALGDDILTEEELAMLTELKTPLTNIRGRWVILYRDEVEKITAALKKLPDKIERKEALLSSLRQEHMDAPLSEVTGSPWIANVRSLILGTEPLEEMAAPEGFAGQLRPYQAKGLAWLARLVRLGMGACLADDMGLGKTVQTLALIRNLRLVGERRPVLLICPTSVMENWRRETERFIPGTKTLIHHGMKRNKKNVFTDEALAETLVISSYSLLYRDNSLFSKVEWAGIILDEAQNIKNPDTCQSRAARSVRADWHIALTGTPVENHVGDMWSIMEFLMPGLMPNRARFSREILRPVQAGEKKAMDRVRRMTAPFILRRLKTDKEIISDLPEKIESKEFCPLSREQATLYSAVTSSLEREIEGTEGIRRKGVVLGAITALKQICDHPLLYLKDKSEIDNRSGKLARLAEIAEEMLAAGDRALIFTQYAEMGELLKKFIQETFGREALFLHGGVPREKRDEMVRRFQEEEEGPPFFVLSLNAGGTGLNLTRANHVVMFDRWWNPAVEQQAVDRAYRIGQQNNVQVHYFCCRGTLEEKIESLIEAKRELANMLVGTGESWLSDLSDSDLHELFSLEREAVDNI